MEFNNNFNKVDYIKQQAAKMNRNNGINNKQVNPTTNTRKTTNTIARVNALKEFNRPNFNQGQGK